MKKINHGFLCRSCKVKVGPAKATCRNHCPYCFCSLHVDQDTPGDRLSVCQGKMYPINFLFGTKLIVIIFKCEKCGKIHHNKQAVDDNTTELSKYINYYKQKNNEKPNII